MTVVYSQVCLCACVFPLSLRRIWEGKISVLIVMLIWCQVITGLYSCLVLRAAKSLSIQLFNGIVVWTIRLYMIINIQGKEATKSMDGNTALSVSA